MCGKGKNNLTHPSTTCWLKLSMMLLVLASLLQFTCSALHQFHFCLTSCCRQFCSNITSKSRSFTKQKIKKSLPSQPFQKLHLQNQFQVYLRTPKWGSWNAVLPRGLCMPAELHSQFLCSDKFRCKLAQSSDHIHRFYAFLELIEIKNKI